MSKRKPRLEWSQSPLEDVDTLVHAQAGGLLLTVYAQEDGHTWDALAATVTNGDRGTRANGFAPRLIDAQLAAEDAALALLEQAVAALGDSP